MGNSEFEKLRVKHGAFHYKSFTVNDGESLSFSFDYSIDGLSDFRTTWDIKKVQKASYDKAKLDELIFSLGLVEALSVWKLTCSERFFVDCHSLDNEQVKWFKKLLINGMGEFFYRNGIEIEKYGDKIVDVICIDKINQSCFGSEVIEKDDAFNKKSETTIDKVLIPIGGGKDSAVSIEILKEDADRYCFIINERKATRDTFIKSGLKEDKLILAKRVFDEKIVKLNSEGYLNGHTPFSALVSFASVIAAYINGIKYVALSNESSANESTVKGLLVNHQYSKTYEYETDFRNYEKKYIDSGVDYFSLLRPLTEVGIAKIFASLPNYHYIFRSCNVGSKTDSWCKACAKCLFVYIILSPFIEKRKMKEIFGKDLLDDENLIDIFDKLIGRVPEKPFECVGSREEVNAALSYILKVYEETDYMPKLLKHYKELNMKNSSLLMDLCMSYDDNNHVPAQFIKCIKKAQL